MKLKIGRLLIAIILGLGFVGIGLELMGLDGVFAASYIITRLDDPVPNISCSTNCSLREAILKSNANAGADSILLDAGTYQLTQTGSNEDGAVTGDLDILDDLTILGIGSDQTIINANGLDRVLDILTGTVVISGVTLRGGDQVVDGGGIFHWGLNLILTNTVVSDNTAQDYGGGIYIEAGDAVINGGEIKNNRTTGNFFGGGGIYVGTGHLIFEEGQVINNVTEGGLTSGAGIYVDEGLATINGGQIISNTADFDGAGIYAFLGEVIINGGQIVDNLAIISNNGRGGGVATDLGQVTMNGGEIINNQATEGGGVYIYDGGTFTQLGGLIGLNRTIYSGGGLSLFGEATFAGGQIISNTTDLNGGGIYVDSSTAIDIDSVQISHNTANTGGGIYVTASSSLNVTNSTLSLNSGEGIYNVGSSQLKFSTVASNTAALYNSGNMILQNSIVAYNGGNDCSGSFSSDGYNIASDASCNFALSTDFNQVDPLLAPLADNGGNNKTHALLMGSPAIDAGLCLSGVSTDQRGEPRPGPTSALCDMGAFERNEEIIAADALIQKSVIPSIVLPGEIITYTVIFTNNGPSTLPSLVITDILPSSALFDPQTVIDSGNMTQTNGPPNYSWQVGPLDPGTGGQMILTGQVTPGLTISTSTTFSNTVLLSSPFDTESSNNSSTAAVTILATSEADLSLSKIVVPEQVEVGAQAVYTITVNNLDAGTEIAPGVVVTDTLPTGVIYVDSVPSQGSCVINGSTLACSLGDVTTVATIRIVVVANQLGSWVNSAELASEIPDPQAGNNQDTASLVIQPAVEEAELAVIKEVTPAAISVGGSVTYLIRVTNYGPAAATGIVLEDSLFDLGPSANGFSLPPGASSTFTINHTPSSEGTVVNTARIVSADQVDLFTGNNVATATVAVGPTNTQLFLTKQAAQSQIFVGESLLYQVTVGNSGSDAALGITISDPVPDNVTVDTANLDSDCFVSAKTVYCVLTQLGAGQTEQFDIPVIPAVPMDLVNTAYLVSNFPSSNQSSNSITTKVSAGEVDLIMSQAVILPADQQLFVGDRMTYTLEILNAGPDSATGVTVTDSLPGQVQFSSVVASQGSCNGGSQINCSLGTIAAGQNAQITIAVIVVQSGTFNNTASVQSGNFITELNPANNTASSGAITAVEPQQNLTISKQVSTNQILLGNPFTYTISVTNGASDRINFVQVFDQLPLGLDIEVEPSSLCQNNTNDLTCNLGTLQAGESQIIYLKAIPAAVLTVTNVATVEALYLPASRQTTPPVTTIVDPVVAVGNTLIYTDSRGNPTVISVPDGGAKFDTKLIYKSISPFPSYSPPSEMAFAKHGFTLEAYRFFWNGDPDIGPLSFDDLFLLPLTVTIKYADSDIFAVAEESLNLYYWDLSEESWVKATESCQPPGASDLDIAANQITLNMCQVTDGVYAGEFALFGESIFDAAAYLPLILKRGP